MESIFILYGIFIILWLYSFISALKNTFHNNINKLVWIVALIFLPISAILYIFIAPKQIRSEDSEYIEVAMTLELRTDNEQQAQDIIDELNHTNINMEKAFKDIAKKYQNVSLTHSRKDGYWALRARTEEISEAISSLKNGQLYQTPIKYHFKNEIYYFILYLIDKKYKWV